MNQQSYIEWNRGLMNSFTAYATAHAGTLVYNNPIQWQTNFFGSGIVKMLDGGLPSKPLSSNRQWLDKRVEEMRVKL